jgi:hypothetical protein
MVVKFYYNREQKFIYIYLCRNDIERALIRITHISFLLFYFFEKKEQIFIALEGNGKS